MTILRTTLPGIVVAPLEAHHAPILFQLVQDNRSHLTAHGDYADQVASSLEGLVDELSNPTKGGFQFGIFVQQELIGRIDLVPVDPPRYGIGYWLAQSSTGKGYATAALNAAVEFACIELVATDIYAGVTHGNWRSAAVLERAHFKPNERFERYTRYHRALVG